MSIDAQVKTVHLYENGGGRLHLIDRPAERPGENDGIAGQDTLTFLECPEEVTALNGLNVWGNDSCLMLGYHKIADRKGYTQITFVNDAAFKHAVGEYHRRCTKAIA